jgi:hypothetical protein
MAGVWDEHQQQQHHAEDMNEEEEDDDEEDILDMGGGGDGGIGGAPNEAEQREALLMRFCPNDSSMLYPEVSSLNLRVGFSFSFLLWLFVAEIL